MSHSSGFAHHTHHRTYSICCNICSSIDREFCDCNIMSSNSRRRDSSLIVYCQADYTTHACQYATGTSPSNRQLFYLHGHVFRTPHMECSVCCHSNEVIYFSACLQHECVCTLKRDMSADHNALQCFVVLYVCISFVVPRHTIQCYFWLSIV